MLFVVITTYVSIFLGVVNKICRLITNVLFILTAVFVAVVETIFSFVSVSELVTFSVVIDLIVVVDELISIALVFV